MERIDLAEYFWLAEQVTGIDATILANTSRSDLADSDATEEFEDLMGRLRATEELSYVERELDIQLAHQ